MCVQPGLPAYAAVLFLSISGDASSLFPPGGLHRHHSSEGAKMSAGMKSNLAGAVGEDLRQKLQGFTTSVPTAAKALGLSQASAYRAVPGRTACDQIGWDYSGVRAGPSQDARLARKSGGLIVTTVATQGALALVEPLHYVPSIEPAAFDYSILPDDVADEARAVAQRVSGRNQRQNDLAFDTGKDLLSIKDRLGHGNWGKWLKAEFNWTERTAQNFMSVAQKFEGKYETVSHLPATTVYALAGPSTPEPLRNQIIERLEQGDISAGEIKTILSDAKAEAMQAAGMRSVLPRGADPLQLYRRRRKGRARAPRGGSR